MQWLITDSGRKNINKNIHTDCRTDIDRQTDRRMIKSTVYKFFCIPTIDVNYHYLCKRRSRSSYSSVIFLKPDRIAHWPTWHDTVNCKSIF